LDRAAVVKSYGYTCHLVIDRSVNVRNAVGDQNDVGDCMGRTELQQLKIYRPSASSKIIAYHFEFFPGKVGHQHLRFASTAGSETAKA